MAQALTTSDDARKGAAADWLARLSAADLDASEAEAFDAWASDPANGRAYDAALAVMLEVQAAAPSIMRQLEAQPAPRRRSASRAWIALGGVAAAVTLAVGLVPFGAFAPKTQDFVTTKGEHRTVRLADGSTVEMNGGSTLKVTLARHERRLSLPQGEAIFDVAPDKARPFLIAAGDRTVRVVGTRFDVRRLGQELSVTVERGVVEVRPAEGQQGRIWRLHPGQRLDLVESAFAPAPQLSEVDPVAVESWRTGRLIYRDRPLSEVVADLNQQFSVPIVLEDPALGATRISGVLILDNEQAVTRRLALLAPLKALPSAKGILLRSDPAARP
ncbi:MAG: FecR domain-containing protein [Proteobacteria bacterium]|nr:FecR domain-containing protein [Pseudomonadota bacterium]